MRSLFLTLKKPLYLLLTCVLAVAFFALYTFFDFRQGGTHLTIFTTHTESLQFFLARFGPLYVWSRSALDLVISLLSAILIAFVIDNHRRGSGMFGTACSTGGTVFLGLVTFGCPSCVLPIAGTLGIVFSSQALPLLGFEFKLLSLVLLLGTFFWLMYRLKQVEEPPMPMKHAPSGTL